MIAIVVTWMHDGVLRNEAYGPFEHLDDPEIGAFSKAWRAKYGDSINATAYLLTSPGAV